MAITSKQKKELRKILEKISTPEEMRAFDNEILNEKNDKTKSEIIQKIEAKADFDPSYIDKLIAKATKFLADKIDVLNSKNIPIYDDSELKKMVGNLGDSLHEHASVRDAAARNQKQMLSEQKETNNILMQIGELLKQKEESKKPEELASIDKTLLESYKTLRDILSKTGSNDSVRLKDSTATVINPATEETLQTVADPLIQYKTAGMDIASNPFYFGYINTKGAWYIKKLDTTSGITWTNGTLGYDTAWTGRAGLSYQEFNQLTW